MSLSLHHRAVRSAKSKAYYHANKASKPAPPVESEPHVCLPAIPLPLTERPSGPAAKRPSGDFNVKPFDKLPAPARELVLSGGETLATAPITQQPLTRAELERERNCLDREAATIARRQRQIAEELLNLPTAA